MSMVEKIQWGASDWCAVDVVVASVVVNVVALEVEVRNGLGC